MNELSCNSICQLLCCPPVPSKIAAKLAFMPPPPSYKLQSVVERGETKYIFTLAPFIKDSILQYMPNNIEAVKATTRKGNEIAMLYMKINSSSKLTFLLSHGNAVDLGLMIHFMFELGSKLNVNIMCYDYSGYGVSTGKPLEKHLYADAECALNQLITRFAIPLDHIVLYGQSIGTVPTVHLATLHPVAAVVLHSPLMSGLRVAFPRLKRNYCCDVFSNLARAPRILSPTLVIHGTRDDVINVSHGQRLCSALSDNLLLDPLFIDGAGHNDCEQFPQYLVRLIKLVTVELPNINSRKTNLSDSSAPPAAGDFSTPAVSDHVSLDDSETELSNSETLSSDGSHLKLLGNTNSLGPEQSKATKSVNSHTQFKIGTKGESSTINSRGELCVSQTDPKQLSFQLSDSNHSSLTELTKSDTRDITDPSIKINPPPKIDQPIVVKTSASDNSIEIRNEVSAPQTPDNRRSDCLTPTLIISLNSDLPPPPPPPISNGIDLLTSNEVLWSLHGMKDRKILTLPRNLIPSDLSAIKHVKNKSKVYTLPRDLPSLKKDEFVDVSSLSENFSDSDSNLASDLDNCHDTE